VRQESLGLLRALALMALGAGAMGSIGVMLRVGRRAPRFLLVLFAVWVLSPFIGLAIADKASKRWPARTRATLYSVMLVLALGSFAIYVDVVLRPPAATPAFRFVVVPLASWLLMTTAALISGKLSRGQTGG
jgi:hypothetical protein